jgi:hypothetical protein
MPRTIEELPDFDRVIAGQRAALIRSCSERIRDLEAQMADLRCRAAEVAVARAGGESRLARQLSRAGWPEGDEFTSQGHSFRLERGGVLYLGAEPPADGEAPGDEAAEHLHEYCESTRVES